MQKNKSNKSAEPKAKPAAAAAAAAADAVIKAMPDALIVLDLNGVILNVNPAYTRMFGWELEDRIGKSFTELKSLKPEDIERFMKLLGQLIETGHVEPIETVIGTKDGREIPISVGYSLIKDTEGNPKNIVAVLRDITELKRAEEERVRALKTTADTIEAMPIGVVVHDLDGKILQVNETAEKMFGYKREEAIGKPIVDFVAEEDRARAIESMLKGLREGFTKDFECMVVRKDGNKFSVLVDSTSMKDSEGNPTSIVISFRDITELKRAEEERVKVLKSTTDAMTDAVVVLDLDGNVVSVNPAVLNMFGRKPEEIVGKSMLEVPGIEFVKPDDIGRFMPLLKEAIEKGSSRPIEFVAVAKDGRKIPVNVAGGVIRDAQGNPMNVVAVLRDITELKKAEEERVKAVSATTAEKARAEEAEKFTKQLEAKVKDLEDFRRLAVGRELKMKKMEEEMEELKKRLEEK